MLVTFLTREVSKKNPALLAMVIVVEEGWMGDDPVGGRGPNWNSGASQKFRYYSRWSSGAGVAGWLGIATKFN